MNRVALHSSFIRLAPNSFSVMLLVVFTGSFRCREGQCPAIILPTSLSLLTTIHGHRHTIQRYVISVAAVVPNYLGLKLWIKGNYSSRYVTSLSVRNCSSRSQPHSSSSSSSSSIQPEGRLWQEPEPSHATGMALAHCILGSFLGVVCHCFPPPLDVSTFASRCLHLHAT